MAALLHVLGRYLMRRGELIDFYHGEFRAAAGDTWLNTAAQRQAAHIQLAGFFERKVFSSRTVDCLPWHLFRADAWARLRDGLSDLVARYFEAMFSDPVSRYDLLSYWQALAPTYNTGITYEDALAGYRLEVPPEWDTSDLVGVIAAFLIFAGQWDSADRMLSQAPTASFVSIRISMAGKATCEKHLP